MNFFNKHDGAAICAACAPSGALANPSFLPLDSGATRWLRDIETIAPQDLARCAISPPSLINAKNVAMQVLAAAFGRHLKSWMW
jgi:hypothetical protein